MVEWACLENRCVRKGTVGSNPTLSADPDHRRGSRVFTLTGKHLRAVLLVFALLLTACSSAIAGGNRLAAQDAAPTNVPLILVQANTPVPRPAPAAQQTPEPTRMVLWWPEQLAPGDSPLAMELLTSQLEAFQSFLGNVTLQLRLKAGSGANDILHTLRAASPVAPGVLPDLTLMRRADMLAAARDGLIHSLEDLVPTATLDDLFPTALDLGRIDGELYGLPWLLTLQHMAWSRQRADAPLARFADLLESQTRFAMAAADPGRMNNLLLMQYLAAGGRLPTDAERPEDVAAWQHTLAFYEQALAQELLDPAVTGYSTTANYADLLLAGELDAAVLGSDDWLGLQAAGARLGYGPVPTLDGAQASVLEGWMWVLVTDSSGRQALSGRFLDWMLGSGRQSEFARSVAMLPSRNTAWGMLEATPYLDFARELLANAVLPLAGGEEGAAINSARNAFLSVLNGEADAATATDDLIRRLAG